MKKHYRHENDCLNCGTILEGHFCHNCGQENLEMNESFGHMVTHAVSDYFHFDYQFFHTLKPLFAKPGKLTVDYLAGRRAQYLHPVKMYIFISLLFFVVLLAGGKHADKDESKKMAVTDQRIIDSVKNDFIKNIHQGKPLNEAEKKAIYDNTEVTAAVNTRTKKIKYGAKYNGFERNVLKVRTEKYKSYEEYIAAQNKLPQDQRDNFITQYIAKKIYSWQTHGEDAQETFVEGLKHNAPKFMFLLLPLFALILKIAFYRNHKLYVEHIIHSIHLHCFIFLFLLMVMLINRYILFSWKDIRDWMGIVAFGVIAWYVYRSLKTVYQRSRWRTISKMFGIAFMYMLVSVICFVIFAAITAITSV